MNFLKLLSEARTPLLNDIFQFITYFGQEVLIISIICLLYWCVNKRLAYILGFTYFTAGLLIQTMKITFRIPRPWVLDTAFEPVKSAVAGATGYSFPSGHTMGGTCLFAPLALHVKRNIYKVLCTLSFLLIGFSRLYLGVHTPKDVMVSMALSLVVCILIYRCQHLLLDTQNYTLKITLLLSFIAMCVAVYSLSLLSKGLIDTHYAMDCCKTAGAGLGFAIGYYIERTYLNFNTTTRTFWGQIYKVLFGLLIALFLKEGLALFFEKTVLFKMIQYLILVLWVLAIYPYIFSKFSKKD